MSQALRWLLWISHYVRAQTRSVLILQTFFFFFFFFPVDLNLLKVYGLVSVGNTRAPVPFAPYSLTMNLTVRKSDCRGSLVVKLSHILIHP